MLHLKLVAQGCNVNSSGYIGANCTGLATFSDLHPTVSDFLVQSRYSMRIGGVVLIPPLARQGVLPGSDMAAPPSGFFLDHRCC